VLTVFKYALSTILNRTEPTVVGEVFARMVRF
jgi:hypothetical protein